MYLFERKAAGSGRVRIYVEAHVDGLGGQRRCIEWVLKREGI